MRARDRRADPLVSEGLRRAGAFGHELRQPRPGRPLPKKASSKSGTASDTSTYARVVEAYDGPFGADRAEAHELHGVS